MRTTAGVSWLTLGIIKSGMCGRLPTRGSGIDGDTHTDDPRIKSKESKKSTVHFLLVLEGVRAWGTYVDRACLSELVEAPALNLES